MKNFYIAMVIGRIVPTINTRLSMRIIREEVHNEDNLIDIVIKVHLV